MSLDARIGRLLAACEVRVRLELLDLLLALQTRSIIAAALVPGLDRVLRAFLEDPSVQVRRRAERLFAEAAPQLPLAAERGKGAAEPILESFHHRPLIPPREPARFSAGGDKAAPTEAEEDAAVDSADSDGLREAPWLRPGALAVPAPADSAEAVIRRHTHCELAVNPRQPAAGRLLFALRVAAADAESRPVDLRVPAGRPVATVLVHAFSSQFEVGPEVRAVRVPRAADSDTAEFSVRATRAGEGEVGLLVYDERRLIGSLAMRLRAADGPQGLALEKVGAVVFRDPGAANPTAARGISIQVSLGPDGRVAFHLLLGSDEGEPSWPPSLYPLGRSADPLAVDSLQGALAALRGAVEEIENGLDNPASLGAACGDEALQGIRLSLDGVGRQITEDILSPAVRLVLAGLRSGTVVSWVIRDASLDGVPWELSWNPASGGPFALDLVLARVPVRGDQEEAGSAADLPTAPVLPPAPGRLLYVLGANVAPPAQLPIVREAVSGIAGCEVITNFDGGQRQPVSVVALGEQLKTARFVHLLCHGVVERDRGLYLEIEANALGRLTPLQVRGFRLPPNAVVFVNACSSAAATMSVSGLKTFGWSFLAAGARAYVGTLAPVTTRLALRFARSFFASHLTQGAPLDQALFAARQSCAGQADPTWLLYAFYGDPSEAH